MDHKKPQITLLKECVQLILTEKLRSKSFNWDEFKKIKDLKEVERYAQMHLKFLGAGSSRATFILNSKKVLKIATKRLKGRAQNKAEVDIITNPNHKSALTQIYDLDADNYNWIVSDLVRPISNEDEFFKLTSLDFDDFYDSLFGSHPKAGYYYSAKEDEHPLTKSTAHLIKTTKLMPGDLMDVEHWGKTADGRVVLYDYGFTTEVYDTFYS